MPAYREKFQRFGFDLKYLRFMFGFRIARMQLFSFQFDYFKTYGFCLSSCHFFSGLPTPVPAFLINDFENRPIEFR